MIDHLRCAGPVRPRALRCGVRSLAAVGGCPRTPSVSACASLVPYINSVSRAVPFPTRRRPERNAGSFRAGPGAGCAVTRPRARGGASPQGAPSRATPGGRALMPPAVAPARRRAGAGRGLAYALRSCPSLRSPRGAASQRHLWTDLSAADIPHREDPDLCKDDRTSKRTERPRTVRTTHDADGLLVTAHTRRLVVVQSAQNTPCSNLYAVSLFT